MTLKELEKKKRKNNKNKSSNSKGKKVVAIILVGVTVFASGGLTALLHGCSKKEKEQKEQSGSEKPSFGYVLYQPTDMNNDEDFDKLLSKANTVAGKDLDKNVIRYFNHSELKEEKRLTRDDYKDKSDEEIADTVYNYPIEYYDWLDSKTFDDLINVKVGVLTGDSSTSSISKSDCEILTPFATTDKNSYLYQTYEIAYDTIIDEEVGDILDSNTKDFIENAKAFYDIVKQIMSDPKVSENQNLKAMFLEGAKKDYRLFAGILKAEYPEYYAWLEKEFQNNTANSWTGSFLDYLGIVFDAEACAKKIKNSDKYNPEDAELAKAYTKAVEDGKVTKKTSKDVKHKSEVVSEGTTSTSKSTTVHDVPDTTRPTETHEGGKPVDKPEVSENTTHKIEEEDVKPETTKPTTTSSYEETYTPGYVDADGTIWVDENDWQKIK